MEDGSVSGAHPEGGRSADISSDPQQLAGQHRHRQAGDRQENAIAANFSEPDWFGSDTSCPNADVQTRAATIAARTVRCLTRVL